MGTSFRSFFTCSMLALCLNATLPFCSHSVASISVPSNGYLYTQDFNGLAATGTSNTWTNDNTIAGWFAGRNSGGAAAVTTYQASAGTATAGSLYSFGSSADRALGSIGSGNAAAGDFAWGVLFQNNTGLPIESIEISYTGEQWRKGGGTSAQTLDFYFMVDNLASPGPPGAADFDLAADTSGWNSVAALNFASPINTTTGTALDGNLAPNRSALSSTVSLSTPVAAGKWLWIGFRDIDHSGTDHGLSVDDFSARFTTRDLGTIPELSAFTIWSALLGSVLVGAKRRRDVA